MVRVTEIEPAEPHYGTALAPPVAARIVTRSLTGVGREISVELARRDGCGWVERASVDWDCEELRMGGGEALQDGTAMPVPLAQRFAFRPVGDGSDALVAWVTPEYPVAWHMDAGGDGDDVWIFHVCERETGRLVVVASLRWWKDASDGSRNGGVDLTLHRSPTERHWRYIVLGAALLKQKGDLNFQFED